MTMTAPTVFQDKDEVKIAFWVAEYKALRDEILHYSNLRARLVELTVVVTGTLLTIGFERGEALILLIQPLLILLLAIKWADNSKALLRLADYIRNVLERDTPLHWETALVHETQNRKVFQPLSILSTGGIFLGTQIMSVTAAVLKFGSEFAGEERALLGVSIVFIAITVALVRYVALLKKSPVRFVS